MFFRNLSMHTPGFYYSSAAADLMMACSIEASRIPYMYLFSRGRMPGFKYYAHLYIKFPTF